MENSEFNIPAENMRERENNSKALPAIAVVTIAPSLPLFLSLLNTRVFVLVQCAWEPVLADDPTSL